jgi:hypothetical protein
VRSAKQRGVRARGSWVLFFLALPLRARTCEIWHAKSAGFAVAASCVEPAPSRNAAPPPIPSPPPFRFCGIAFARPDLLPLWVTSRPTRALRGASLALKMQGTTDVRGTISSAEMTADGGAAQRTIELAR